MNKLKALGNYLADRATEASTWRGVAGILAMVGSRYAGFDQTTAVTAAIVLSGAMKILLADNVATPATGEQEQST